jgi:ABC-type multidrug transport system fused ATPase/permease subunit
MIKIIRDLFSVLTPSQKKRFYILQILVMLMAVTQIAGVASIVPFMALVADMNQLNQDTIFAQAFIISGIASEGLFVFLLGVGVLVMLFLGTIISMYTTWRLSLFANKVGVEIADSLYSYYLKKDWLFHASGSSAQLTKQIATESLRVTTSILLPLVHMNGNFVLVLFMSISIFLFDPMVALVGVIIFSIAYFVVFNLVNLTLLRNGRTISEMHEIRFRLMNEGFGGIKDVLLLGRFNDFINRFNKTGTKFAYNSGVNGALAHIPRYFMEFVAFGSMIALVLYLFAAYEGDISMILPILSLYAIAGMKLLPAFQQIYNSLANIKGNIAAFESIQKDLTDSISTKQEKLKSDQNYLTPKKQILLENVTFKYPSKDEAVLNQLNMEIPVNKVIGIVGPSGSGKSTLIDILIGLIEAKEGHLKVDGAIIDDQNRRSWQNTIGFVAQAIFLSEGTIAENVAFGIPQNRIDLNQVNKSLKLANLDEFVGSLKNGIHSKVGERGVQLSGGQRQRIGIARALYHEAKVLIFDEATSSLDGITEKTIMKAIHQFSGQKTIIMIAHRLKTIQKCDQIFVVDDGRVADQGTFEELIEKNEVFKKMALHA